MSKHRVLLKISGEALSGDQPHGINEEALSKTALEISKLHQSGIEVGLVVGGGNFFRGLQGGPSLGVERSSADQIGMLATVMNGIALRQALQFHGSAAHILTSFECPAIGERFRHDLAMEYLKQGVTLFVGGTGHPYFTTDTAAALRASEIKADCLLKATMHVDGVYDADPNKVKGAKRLQTISYQDYLSKGLGILDLTAITLCMTNKIPVRVFNFQGGPLRQAYEGKFGTYIGD